MSFSFLEKTTEKSRSNCANVAWELSFSTGFAWWRTRRASYLVVADSFCSCSKATLIWANVLASRFVNVASVETRSFALLQD